MTLPARMAFWAKEAALRRGTLALMPETLTHSNLSREEIDLCAWQRLGEVVRFSVANVPHYQRLWEGHDIEAALASPKAFATLPISQRVDITASGADCAAPNARGRLVWLKSSGTTGNKIPFVSDFRRSGWSAAARVRARRWWGLKPGARTVAVYNRPLMIGQSLRGRARLLLHSASHRLTGERRLSAYDMSAEDMDCHIATIQRVNPQLLFGYGHTLVRLAERIERQGIEIGRGALQAVIYVSDPMTGAGRETVERVFGASVASEYACSEFGLVAHQCPHGNYHLSDDNLYVETVDAQGRSVVGEIGELVYTDLRVSRTPFVRHRLRDMGELAPADFVCPCGCTQRVLRHFHGRSHHVIPLKDSGCIPPMMLDEPVNVIPGASHWQARVARAGQDDATLSYHIETTPESLEPLRDQLTAWLAERVNHEYAVTVRAVGNIAPSPSGKYVQIIMEDEA